MNGEQVTGFIVTGKIDREKYGISFNQALETGGVMLGRSKIRSFSRIFNFKTNIY